MTSDDLGASVLSGRPGTTQWRPKTILIIHNRYQQRGGEDSVVDSETELLRRNGHDVRLLRVSNDQIDPDASLGRKAALARRTVWSESSKRLVARTLRRHPADVAHVHNTFPLLSPSVYSACHEQGVPVVQTLHNFRLICPVATLYRDGHPCQDCVGKAVPLPGVIHACYRDSVTASATVAAMLAYNRLRGTWERDVDCFLVLSNFARDLFVRGGLPPQRLLVQANHVTAPPGPEVDSPSGFAFVGRLSEEKGVRTLLEAWREFGDIPLTIAGDGPLRPIVAAAARRSPGINAPGFVERSRAFRLMRSVSAVIVPSIVYEGHPLAILEAFAVGRPVIASRLGAMAEFVEHGRTGLLFEPGDPRALRRTVLDALADPARLAEMGRAGQLEFEERYTDVVRYRGLMLAYRFARRTFRQAQGRRIAEPEQGEVDPSMALAGRTR